MLSACRRGRKSSKNLWLRATRPAAPRPGRWTRSRSKRPDHQRRTQSSLTSCHWCLTKMRPASPSTTSISVGTEKHLGFSAQNLTFASAHVTASPSWARTVQARAPFSTCSRRYFGPARAMSATRRACRLGGTPSTSRSLVRGIPSILLSFSHTQRSDASELASRRRSRPTRVWDSSACPRTRTLGQSRNCPVARKHEYNSRS
mmetsp:Transcript_174110/g.558258  ORF Transcript_174110/g.558258 Transcript_174110/m.558258 type:complete len:203 (-) Transcript_174110:579-1187(-)